MSELSKLIKERKENDMDFFFSGGWEKISNKYFKFNRIINDDEIIIVTNNIQYRKNKDIYVLVVDNDKIVYLKSWQVRPVKNWELGENAYIVKLYRKYFKAYRLPFELDNMFFEKEDTFDSLFQLAQEQNQSNIAWAFGQL